MSIKPVSSELPLDTDPLKLPPIKAIIITFGIGLTLWFAGVPEGLDPKAWQLFVIFIGCIVGIITKLMPMGATAILALTIAMLTESFGDGSGANATAALSGFSSSVTWLAAFAFFIARGFIKTGLGKRIAFQFIKLLGQRTLGLSYGLAITDLILAPAMPSITARGGGIIYPVIRSLAESYGSRPEDGSARKIGCFLMQTGFQVNIITASMFITAMAGNPIAVHLLGEQGIHLTWAGWALAMLVPGLVALLLVPLAIYWVSPPEIKATPNAKSFAQQALNEMGPMKSVEKAMLAVFILLLVLWVGGSVLAINSWVAAAVGVSLLLFTGVLDYDDIKNEKGAWDTLIWMSILIIMATYLNKLGFISWMTQLFEHSLAGVSWVAVLLALALVYFYSHYLFASASAHVAAMIVPFTLVAVGAGVPDMMIALLLCAFSNLFAGITHYGIGSAPIFFGAGYVDFNTWWRNGFIISVVNITIWLTVGIGWWRLLGLW